MNRKVYYVWDKNLISQCSRLPAVLERATMVHDLIVSYGLTNGLKVVLSSPASYDELLKFHSDLYIDYLKSITEVDDEYMSNAEDEKHGIGYDCPLLSNMFELVSTIAGGSITAARCLVLGLADIAINWCGGWHHGQRFGADGFCYVNDIVLAIEILRVKFPKVLYIDLDVHHGNGVQDAYSLSKSVFTLSIHKYEPGFYPGTGSLEDIGTMSGKGYSCNFPLHAWYSDATLEYVFGDIYMLNGLSGIGLRMNLNKTKVMFNKHAIPRPIAVQGGALEVVKEYVRTFPSVFESFTPDAIVVQCGADALAHDPQGGANVTARGYCSCLSTILDKRKPTILLGGGGYKHSNAARLWSILTAQVLGETLDENIPEHEYWTKYGPDYTLAIEPMLTKDTNKKDHLEQCVNEIKENLKKYLIPSSSAEPVLKKMKTDIENNFIQSCNKQTTESSITRIFKSNTVRPNKENGDISRISTETKLDVYDFVD